MRSLYVTVKRRIVLLNIALPSVRLFVSEDLKKTADISLSFKCLYTQYSFSSYQVYSVLTYNINIFYKFQNEL